MKCFSDSGLGSIFRSVPGWIALAGRMREQASITPTCQAPRHCGGNSSLRSPGSWTDGCTGTWPEDPGETQPSPRCAAAWSPLLGERGGETEWARGCPLSRSQQSGAVYPSTSAHVRRCYPHTMTDKCSPCQLLQTHIAVILRKRKKKNKTQWGSPQNQQRQAGEAMSHSEWEKDAWGSPSLHTECRPTP